MRYPAFAFSLFLFLSIANAIPIYAGSSIYRTFPNCLDLNITLLCSLPIEGEFLPSPNCRLVENQTYLNVWSCDCSNGYVSNLTIAPNAKNDCLIIYDYIQAIEYYLKSAELRADLGKYLDAAIIYKCIADCYRAMGDAESAAEYYFRYAEYGLMDEKGLSSIEGFKIASDIYLKLAESLPQMSEEKLKKVIALYKKLGKSYSGLRDYPKSGDSYFRAADLEQDLGFKKQTQTFMDAIKEYEKADKLWDIGRSYNRIKQL